MQAGYVRNIAQNPRVRVKVRQGIHAAWLSGTAHLLPEDDPRERQRWLARFDPAARQMQPLCASWERNYSQCGLTWTKSEGGTLLPASVLA